MRISFDPDKRARTLQERGLDFEDAEAPVGEDPVVARVRVGVENAAAHELDPEGVGELADEAVPVQKLLDCIQRGAGAVLRDTTVFDIYRGAGIENGRKSVAIGLNLQDVSRTLTDEETDAIVARVVSDLERECSATIRDR